MRVRKIKTKTKGWRVEKKPTGARERSEACERVVATWFVKKIQLLKFCGDKIFVYLCGTRNNL